MQDAGATAAIGGIMVAVISTIGVIMTQRTGRVEKQLNGTAGGVTIGQLLEQMVHRQDRQIELLAGLGAELKTFVEYQHDRNHDMLGALASMSGLRTILPELLTETKPGDVAEVLEELNKRGEVGTTEAVLAALAAVQARRG